MARHFLFFISIALLCAACDKSDCPYVNERLCDQAYRDSIANDTITTGGGIGTDTGTVVGNFVVYSPEVFQTYESAVQLEDFTGFRCSNCALALATGENLSNQWGERITVLAYHVFPEFAAPIADPPAPFSTDFRTSAGESYATEFQLNALPNGMINRKNFGTGVIQSVGNWADRVSELLEQEPTGFIRFRDIRYDPISRNLTARVAVAPLMPMSGNILLTIGLLESGIIEAQKNGTETIFPFTHNHVFRGNVNGLYGSPAWPSGTIFEANSAYLHPMEFTLPENWNEEKMSLFAYLHFESTRVIIQTSEQKIFE